MSHSDLNRREFIKSAVLVGTAFPLLMGCRTDTAAQMSAQKAATDLELIKKNAATTCDSWCGAQVWREEHLARRDEELKLRLPRLHVWKRFLMF